MWSLRRRDPWRCLFWRITRVESCTQLSMATVLWNPWKGDFSRSNFKGNISMGLDSEGFTMSLFGLNYSNPKYDIYGEAMVQQISDERCLIQSETITARQNSELVGMESDIFFNATASISNPSIFDIPKECRSVRFSRRITNLASRYAMYLHGLKTWNWNFRFTKV